MNAPVRPYQRSVSPEIEAPRSAIPLFNTSAKRLAARLADYDPMSLDSSKAPSPAESVTSAMELEGIDAGASGKAPKKSSFQDKIKTARASVEEAETKGKSKLAGKPKGRAGEKGKGFSLPGGKDYMKEFESRPGGFFKKKLR